MHNNYNYNTFHLNGSMKQSSKNSQKGIRAAFRDLTNLEHLKSRSKKEEATKDDTTKSVQRSSLPYTPEDYTKTTCTVDLSSIRLHYKKGEALEKMTW